MQTRSRFSMTASLAALVILTMLTAAASAQAQNTVGTITQITGAATVQRTGATIGAAAYMPVMLHDEIVTGPGASLTIGLVDNSSLQLGASSTLTIDESMLVNGVGAPSRVGLLGGALHSLIVGAMSGSSTTFQVNTPNAVGAVRGTGWSETFSDQPQAAYPNCLQFTDVGVQEGSVQVCTGGSQLKCTSECRDVTAGQHITVACCAFVEESAGGAGAGVGVLGVAGATALGIGIVAGGVIGGYAAAGGFNGPTHHVASPAQ